MRIKFKGPPGKVDVRVFTRRLELVAESATDEVKMASLLRSLLGLPVHFRPDQTVLVKGGEWSDKKKDD